MMPRRRFILAVLVPALLSMLAAAPARAKDAKDKDAGFYISGISPAGSASANIEAWTRSQLVVSDEDWRVLWPRLKRVYILRDTLRFAQGHWLTDAGNAEARDVPACALDAHNDYIALAQAAQGGVGIQERFDALQADVNRARRDLVGAQKSLREIVTVRQEGWLVIQFLLDPAPPSKAGPVAASRPATGVQAAPGIPGVPAGDPKAQEEQYETAMKAWRKVMAAQGAQVRGLLGFSDDEWKAVWPHYRRACMLKAGMGDYRYAWAFPPLKKMYLSPDAPPVLDRGAGLQADEKADEAPDYVAESYLARQRLVALMRSADPSGDAIKAELGVLSRNFPPLRDDLGRTIKSLSRSLTVDQEVKLVTFWLFDESVPAQ